MDSRLLKNMSRAVEPAEISDREYWQQERQKIVWDFLIFFAAVVIIAIAVRTAAWFASNREVSGSNMVVSVQNDMFELRVAGNNVVDGNINSSINIFSKADENNYARGLTDADGIPVEAGTGWQGADVPAGYMTGEGNATIKWRLTNEDMKAGIGPNSQGAFTFYVVPKSTGTLTINFELGIRGYMAEQTKQEDGTYNVSSLTEISTIDNSTQNAIENANAVGYLNSHILFFEERTEEPPYAYSKLCDKSGFQRTFENVQKDVPIPVTLYWIWPNTLGQMVFAASENGGRIAVAADAGEENGTTKVQLQQYLLDEATVLFKGVSNPKSLMSDMETVNEENIYTFNRNKLRTNYSILSMGYNEADQAVGTRIQYMLLILTASQG
ncbi:MAG: hypothetical protein IJ833_00025 [Lachnospiraceae bacterium]|nr:hypothetical protein [Lachnospiraceae bacterium]